MVPIAPTDALQPLDHVHWKTANKHCPASAPRPGSHWTHAKENRPALWLSTRAFPCAMGTLRLELRYLFYHS